MSTKPKQDNAEQEYQDFLVKLRLQLKSYRGSYNRIIGRAKISRQRLHKIMTGDVRNPIVIDIAVAVLKEQKKSRDEQYRKMSKLIQTAI